MLGTRKYTKLDFFGLDLPTFTHLPVNLTELTFEDCYMEAKSLHALLASVSETLQLLNVNRCMLFAEVCDLLFSVDFYFSLRTELQPLQFTKLRTLILVDLTHRLELILLSINKATNLIELGLIRNNFLTKTEVATMFVVLIKSNLTLEILHVPRVATEMFLTYSLSNID